MAGVARWPYCECVVGEILGCDVGVELGESKENGCSLAMSAEASDQR